MITCRYFSRPKRAFSAKNPFRGKKRKGPPLMYFVIAGIIKRKDHPAGEGGVRR